MANLLVIFVCLAAGVLLRRSGRFTEAAPAALGTFVVFVSLPALVLAQVPPLLATASLDSDVLVRAGTTVGDIAPSVTALLLFGSAFAAVGLALFRFERM